MAITFDTSFYNPSVTTYLDVIQSPVITPLNNFLYNFQPQNLAEHGLHPFYQHILINLPQLLGPAFLLVFLFPRRSFRLYSALSAVLALSLFPHQEARFLIPAIPLILSSVRLPTKFTRTWIAAWAIFNLFMGGLMGTFHQGGVIPMQFYIASTTDINHVYWWKTYSPPIWLLNGRIEDIETTDFMGRDVEQVVADISKGLKCNMAGHGTVLVAPAAAKGLDKFVGPDGKGLVLTERWRFRSHVSLDDMEVFEDGVWPTLRRVVGGRGLVLWDVERRC
jgi:phosphatidylinositol glycan class Z